MSTLLVLALLVSKILDANRLSFFPFLLADLTDFLRKRKGPVLITDHKIDQSIFIKVSTDQLSADARFVLDVEDLDRKAAESRAKVLMLSYMRGHIPDMDAVMDIGRRRGVPVIEDGAHAHGSAWDGRGAGSIGAIVSCSFQLS